MSTATAVPDTVDLDGDDARDALRSTRSRVLVRDTIARLRWAGLAFAAQLAAVSAGMRETRSVEKIEAGEPDATVVSYAAALRRST